MIKFDITGKATIGYIFITAIIILAGWLVYGNTQSVMLINKAEEQFLARRNLTDSLVYSVLDVNNKERAICLGLSDKLPEFNDAVEQSLAIADSLKSSIGNDCDTARIDSLKYLIELKRQNTFILMKTMGNADADKFYRDKVNSLSQGQDSVMMKQKAIEIKEDKETVYEVVRTKKTFFARLADAFRKQRSDTVHVAQRSKKNVSDSLSHNVDIADTVADVLKQIREQQTMNERRNSNEIKRREQRQQIVGMELTQRISQIMADIRSDEHNALRESLEKDKKARQDVLLKIFLLAVAAAATSVALSLHIRRSIRREREYRHEIEAAKDETERIMKQREQLLLTITHDIKAPAASISGFIELIKSSNIDRQTRLFVENIGVSAKHLLILVGTLLDYHRLDAGRIEPHPVPFCPAALVADSVAAFMPQAGEKGLEMKLEIKSECLNDTYRGDSFRIKQIIDNLIGNAIKYTDSGSVTVTADISAATATGKRWITVSVADTGQGMTAEECRKVFKAFTRLPGAQGTEGVGLGLAITKELTEMLGGKIRLASAKGKGSCFSVCLPLDTAGEMCGGTAADAKQAAGPTAVSGYRRVLIVDDDRLQLKLLTEMLRRIDNGNQLTVKTTVHACEALEEIASFRPDIMFADVEMPEMNGNELIRRIGKRQHLKVFAMTAHEPTIKDELLRNGFDGCLFKPFSMEDLARALNIETAESVGEEEKAPDRFCQLTAFADGDKEAEREIFCNYIAELEEFMKMLDNAPENELRQRVAHIAHKSLPLMKMIGSGICEELSALSPERVAVLSDKILEDEVRQMKDEFREVAEEMRRRI